MYDYLIRFDSQKELDKAYPRPEENPASWMIGDLTVVPVKVLMYVKELDHKDEEGNFVRGYAPAPGYWLGAASTNKLEELPENTVIELERPTSATPWRDCVRRTTLTDIAPVYAVDPTFAGSSYVFD